MSERLTKLPERSNPSFAERLYYIATRKYQGNQHIAKKDRLREMQEALEALEADRAALVKRVEELEGAANRILAVYYNKGNGGYAAYDKWDSDLRRSVDLAAQALGEPQPKGAGE